MIEMTFQEVLEATKLWPPPTPAQQIRAMKQLIRFLSGRSPPRDMPIGVDRGKPVENHWARLFWRAACHGHPGFTYEKKLCDAYSFALRKQWPHALAPKMRARKPQKTVIERRHDRTLTLIKEWERKHRLAGTKLRQLKAKRTYYERELHKRAIRTDAAEFIIDHREQQEKSDA